MKPSLAPKKTSRAKARNAALMNLLGTPGLGSVMAGRVLAGIGQLLVFLTGFTLFSVWAFLNIMHYGQAAFNETPPPPNTWGSKAVIGVALCLVAWVWSLLTSLNLHREAAQSRVESMKVFASGLVKLDEAAIISALAAVPRWQRAGEIISRTFEFKDFPAAMIFVNAVADLAEQAQHHPDIDVRWNKVTLALTTHDADSLTEKDITFARQCDALSRR